MFKLVVIFMLVTMTVAMAPRGKKPPINYKTHKWPALIKERLPPNMPTYKQCMATIAQCELAEKYWPETKEFNPKDWWQRLYKDKLPKDIKSIFDGFNNISASQNPT